MIHLAPFEDVLEHQAYCLEGNVPFEEGSVGFKIFSDEENLGLCQIKFVSGAAYILNLLSIENRISEQMLVNVFSSIIAFLERVEIESIVYPVQTETDVFIAEKSGFDRISDTLFVYDFAAFAEQEDESSDYGEI